MFKTLLIASLFVFATMAFSTNYDEMTSLWSAWKAVHRRLYGSYGEDEARFAIFSDNYQKIQKFNAESETAKLGLNAFADMTAEEFLNKNSRCAFVEDDEEYIRENTVQFTQAELRDLPASVDWREKGVVTPVKNQRQCGSCWAFSTTGVLESYHAIQTGELLSLSEQQIVDCDTADSGCNGGWPYKAIAYAGNNGVEVESDYPYVGRDQKCAYNKDKAVAVNTGYSFVTAKNSDALKAALVQAPVSVAIEADQSVFQFFKSGVITKSCGAGVNHAVLAVGYTKIGGVEAFIVKNSWDTTWGDKGYVYIGTDGTANNGQGVCGILYQPVFAI